MDHIKWLIKQIARRKRKFTDLIHFVDWFPTIVKLAGQKLSIDMKAKMDGISAEWIFKGRKKPKAKNIRRTFIYGVKHEFIGDEWVILYRNSPKMSSSRVDEFSKHFSLILTSQSVRYGVWKYQNYAKVGLSN